jgi:single-strand DNA-binding protein
VEGRLKNRQWQGEDGNTRYTTEVHVQDFTFLTTKKESNANSQSNNQNQQQQESSSTSNTANKVNEPLGASGPEEEDDLPF